MNGLFGDLGGVLRRLAIGLETLADPAVQVRFHAAALAGAEKINTTLGIRGHRVSGQTHRPLRLRLPRRGHGPVDSGPGIRRQTHRRKKDNEWSRTHIAQYATPVSISTVIAGERVGAGLYAEPCRVSIRKSESRGRPCKRSLRAATKTPPG